MQPLSLRKNFSWTFIGRITYAGSQWLILMVLAKLTTPEVVGEFVLGFAITAPIIMFANLQLRLLQATDASGRFELQDYLGLRFLAMAIALIVITVIAYIGNYPKTTAQVIVLVGLAKCIEGLSDILHGLFQRNERMDRTAWSQTIRGILALVGLGVGIYITRDIIVGILGLIIAWVISLIIYDIPTAQKLLRVPVEIGAAKPSLRPRWHFMTMKGLFLLGLPLGVVTLLRSLNANIPRYFIEYNRGLYELGIFGGLVYIITAERRLSQSLGQAVSPRLSQYFMSRDLDKFRRLVIALVTITVSLGSAGLIGTLIAGKQILTFFYSAEYAQFDNLFVLLALAAVFDQTISILGYVLTAARNLLIQVPLDLLNITTLMVGCVLLIPGYGLTGATFALLISKSIGLIASLIVIWRSLRGVQDYQ